MNVRRCLWYGLLLAGGLMGASLSAATAPAAPPADTAPDATATADNQTQNQTPYAPIVERNMFGLVPIPPPAAPVDPATLIPPPKITPNGIMTLFGKLQVLFKVAGVAKPGQPPKDESYVMCEGDRQDDIEVQKIDQTAATITFNNHGVVQALPLVVGAAVGGAAAPAPGGAPPVPGLPTPGMAPGNGGPPLGFGGRFGRGRGVTMGGNQSANANANNPNEGGQPNFGGGFGGGGAPANAGAAQEQISPEQQVIMMEATRLATQEQVNKGLMPPLPPTVLTPPGATGVGGAPLVHTPPGLPGLPAPSGE